MPVNKEEETFPESDPYAWSESSPLSIDDFLAKYKPSMVENDGTKPWLWIRLQEDGSSNSPSIDEQAEALSEASALLSEATEKIEAIKTDDSIPARSSKKTGAKGKKEVREELQAQYKQKLKEISQKHGYVHGKWLLFAKPENIDSLWTKLAKSIHSGPLSSTPIRVAKVATSPAGGVEGFYQHVICLYIPDVYDKEMVRSCMEVLIREHGCHLSGVKSDLYTLIGIDSKHPSGIQSTIWRPADLMKESEIKELQQAFQASSKDSAEKKPTKKQNEKTGKVIEAKDPFASDDDGKKENAAGASSKPASKGKGKAKAYTAKKTAPDPFASDEEEVKGKAKPSSKPASGEGKEKEKEKAKESASAAKEKRSRQEVEDDSSDDSEEERRQAKLKAKRKGF